MDFLEQAQWYFRGEKLTGIAVFVLALVMLAGAAWLWWLQRDDFARGLACVLLAMGILAAAGGGFLALKTDAQVVRLTNQYEQSGAGAQALEGERMEKVVRNFRYYRYVFYAAIVAALALLFFLNGAFTIGIAVGLLLFASLGITVDTYAEARANTYLDTIVDGD